jgi:transcriptional regulator of acetoin/glycerol metabolism
MARAVIMSDGQAVKFDQLGSAPALSGKSPTLNIEENEIMLIRKALMTNGGNVTRAAADLGIDRNALYRRMKKYGIQ